MEQSKLITNSMYVYDVHFITTFCLARRVIALKSIILYHWRTVSSVKTNSTAISCHLKANICSVPQTENSTLYSDKTNVGKGKYICNCHLD